APRPRLSWTFDHPLDPHWRIDDPMALAREPGTGALHMHSSLAKTIARLPLRHDGGTFGVSVEIAVDQVEWGSTIEVKLHGGAVTTGVRVFGEGSVEAPDFAYRGLHPHEAVVLPKVPAGRIRLDHTIYPELELQTVTLEIPGTPKQRHVRPVDVAITPGAMTFELIATSTSPLLVGHARIHRIELHGLELDPAGHDAAGAPDQALARAIVEGELTAALALLPPPGALAPGDLRLLWRSELLARLGDLDGAAAALRRGLDVPEDSPFNAAFTLQLHTTRGPWQLVVDRVLGPKALWFLHDLTALSHPWRPEAVGDALARLAAWPREPVASDSRRLSDQALALIVRGEAWRRFGRPDLARPDLDAAAAIVRRPGLEIPRQMIDELQQRRLELAARTGDRERALELMTAMIREAPSPEIRLERFRGREELVALLRPEDWAALAALTRE
ncbi:MAG TPA: hypothetical protein VGB85_15725, partial [Nannocystis sp.]